MYKWMSAVAITVVTINILLLLKIDGVGNQLDQTQDQLTELKEEVAAIQNYLYKDPIKLGFSKRDRDCLALNIFYEAGIEDNMGKIAVAQVTYNRLKTGRWGSDICSVVYSPAQFCLTLNKNKPPQGELWTLSQVAADNFVNGIRVRGLEDSLFYHADYVAPGWADPEQLITQIGRHIFYNRARRA